MLSRRPRMAEETAREAKGVVRLLAAGDDEGQESTAEGRDHERGKMTVGFGCGGCCGEGEQDQCGEEHERTLASGIRARKDRHAGVSRHQDWLRATGAGLMLRSGSRQPLRSPRWSPPPPHTRTSAAGSPARRYASWRGSDGRVGQACSSDDSKRSVGCGHSRYRTVAGPRADVGARCQTSTQPRPRSGAPVADPSCRRGGQRPD